MIESNTSNTLWQVTPLTPTFSLHLYLCCALYVYTHCVAWTNNIIWYTFTMICHVLSRVVPVVLPWIAQQTSNLSMVTLASEMRVLDLINSVEARSKMMFLLQGMSPGEPLPEKNSWRWRFPGKSLVADFHGLASIFFAPGADRWGLVLFHHRSMYPSLGGHAGLLWTPILSSMDS